MAQLISRRYANALFELAKELGRIDQYNDEVKLAYDAIKNNKDFVTIIDNPQITTTEKLNIFENIFRGKVSDDVLGLFNVVINKNRENLLLEIMEIFLMQVADYKGMVTANVQSAVALDNAQIEAIKNKLTNNLKKQVTVEVDVDPSLIGGLKIQVCGHIIDGTIKKQLDDMKKQLLNTRLA